MTAHMVDPLQDGDPVLLTRVRSGDPEAYALLFDRHRQAATAFAGRLAGPSHADDLVAEAFARVLDALQRDLGPTVSFRSYLLTAIRSIWNNTVRTERRYDLVDDFETLTSVDALVTVDDADRRFDNQTVASAYRSLPERWQAVLWYTAVEGLPHSEVALHLGIKPNAVAALNFRAREGLRQAYLSEHLSTVEDSECRTWAGMLPAYARGSLDRRRRAGLDEHLDGCLSCTAALADLDEVNDRLGALLLPAVLGAGMVGLPGLWAGATSGAVTRARTTATGTGHAGSAVSTTKTVLLAAIAASVVGGAVLAPILLDRSPVEVTGPAQSRVSDYGQQRPADAAPTSTAAAPRERVRPSSRRARPTPAPPRASDRAAAPAPAGGGAPTRATPEGAVLDVPGVAGGPVPTPEPPVAPVEPTHPAQPTVDVALGPVHISQVGVGDAALTRVTIPVAHVGPGTVVTVEITDLLGRPLRLGGDWRCPGTVEENQDPADVVPSTTIACTWGGAEADAADLVLGVVTAGSSRLSASVVPGPGWVDPVTDNNTTSVIIAP